VQIARISRTAESFGIAVRLQEDPSLGGHLVTQVVPLLLRICLDEVVLDDAVTEHDVAFPDICAGHGRGITDRERPVSYRPAKWFPDAAVLALDQA